MNVWWNNKEIPGKRQKLPTTVPSGREGRKRAFGEVSTGLQLYWSKSSDKYVAFFYIFCITGWFIKENHLGEYAACLHTQTSSFLKQLTECALRDTEIEKLWMVPFLHAFWNTSTDAFPKRSVSGTCTNTRGSCECCVWRSPCTRHSWTLRSASPWLCPHIWHTDSWPRCLRYSYLSSLGQNYLFKKKGGGVEFE